MRGLGRRSLLYFFPLLLLLSVVLVTVSHAGISKSRRYERSKQLQPTPQATPPAQVTQVRFHPNICGCL